MTTESHFGYGSHASAALPSVIHRDALGWILAGIADGHREAMLSIEADERFWRLRRTHNNTASMFEAALTVPATARDVANAIARWAPSVGLTARVHVDDADNVRVSLARLNES